LTSAWRFVSGRGRPSWSAPALVPPGLATGSEGGAEVVVDGSALGPGIGAACGPSSRGAAPSGNGLTWSGTGGTAAESGDTADGIATLTVISAGMEGADGSSKVAAPIPVSKENVTKGGETAWSDLVSGPGAASCEELEAVTTLLGAGSGTVGTAGPAGGGPVGSPVSPAGSVLPHDQTHDQSHAHVSGVPAPPSVVTVVSWPQNVNVHVQLQGSVSPSLAAAPEAL